MTTPTGIPSSVAGLVFSPQRFDAGTGYQQLQVSSWLGDGIYDVPLTPAGGGLFEPGTAEKFVTLPQEGTGAIQYVPQGLYTGNLMYVNWDYGEMRILLIDLERGLPIDADTGEATMGTDNPSDIRFAHDMGVGPWDLEFDPLSLDFFVSTWSGNPDNSIVQFTGPGFANQAPIADDQHVETDLGEAMAITLMAMDPDLDELDYVLETDPEHGNLTGDAPELTYEPDPDFAGDDAFTFTASDGELSSAVATVSITVLGAGDDDTAADDDDDDDGGRDCTCSSDGALGAGPAACLGVAVVLVARRRRPSRG